MRQSAAPYLQPGEEIQAIFAGQTRSPFVLPLVGSIIMLIVNRYRIIAVTDQRILVLDSGRWSMRKARAIVTELPRSTRLGPASRVWHKLDTGTGNLYVHRRFFRDIDAADGMTTPTYG
jgi:hypothetical protein